MIDWLARASQHFAGTPGGGTVKTDESRVSSVLSVASTPVGQKFRVHTPTSMTAEQRDECHLGGWDDHEIETFIAREARFKARGRADAEHLAERLTLRDRHRDDRRMCLECRELGPTGRCGAAKRGGLIGADRNLEPVQTILMRCDGFR